jgi:hypothetical protein
MAMKTESASAIGQRGSTKIGCPDSPACVAFCSGFSVVCP